MSKEFLWKTMKSRVLLRHPRLVVVEDDVMLPSGKIVQYLHYAEQRDVVTIICFKGGRLLLQKEYSYPPNEVLYQFPGGGVEKGESPIEAARRELHEESDLWADTLQPLGEFYPSNRRSSAKMYVYLAVDPKEDKGSPDIEEDIISEWINVSDFNKLTQKGEIKNYAALAAWALFTAQFNAHSLKKL